MNTVITGLALTVTCFTGLYLVPNSGVTTTTTTAQQQTSTPCSSHSTLSPSVNPDSSQSEPCNAWASL